MDNYVGTSDNIVIFRTSTNEESKVNLKNVEVLDSTTDIKFERSKNVRNFLLISSIIYVIFISYFELGTFAIPHDQENKIWYQKGWDRYQYQESNGETIYTVKLGKDGKYHTERSWSVFYILLLFPGGLFFISLLMVQKMYSQNKVYFLQNKHQINFKVKELGYKSYILGDFSTTNSVFHEIREQFEKCKLIV